MYNLASSSCEQICTVSQVVDGIIEEECHNYFLEHRFTDYQVITGTRDVQFLKYMLGPKM